MDTQPSTQNLSRGSATFLWRRWLLTSAFVSSIATPLMHYCYMDARIELVRGPMLLPATYLFLRWLGELSVWPPLFAVACWVLGFRHPFFRTPGVAVAVAIFALVFLSLYCFYSVLLLGGEITAAVRHQ
jgi:hypothetical protein